MLLINVGRKASGFEVASKKARPVVLPLRFESIMARIRDVTHARSSTGFWTEHARNGQVQNKHWQTDPPFTQTPDCGSKLENSFEFENLTIRNLKFEGWDVTHWMDERIEVAISFTNKTSTSYNNLWNGILNNTISKKTLLNYIEKHYYVTTLSNCHKDRVLWNCSTLSVNDDIKDTRK